jgi:hypothetical protein
MTLKFRHFWEFSAYFEGYKRQTTVRLAQNELRSINELKSIERSGVTKALDGRGTKYTENCPRLQLLSGFHFELCCFSNATLRISVVDLQLVPGFLLIRYHITPASSRAFSSIYWTNTGGVADRTSFGDPFLAGDSEDCLVKYLPMCRTQNVLVILIILIINTF